MYKGEKKASPHGATYVKCECECKCNFFDHMLACLSLLREEKGKEEESIDGMGFCGADGGIGSGERERVSE